MGLSTPDFADARISPRPRGRYRPQDKRGATEWIHCQSGTAQLSYRRAEEIFEENTRLLANPLASPEDIAAHWGEINDETGYTVPANLMAWSARFLAHLSPDPS